MLPHFPTAIAQEDSLIMNQAAIDREANRMRAAFKRQPSASTLPTLLHSKYFYECTSLLDDPYAPFAGKRVAVIGGGDSGKTVMEFLARVGPGAERSSL